MTDLSGDQCDPLLDMETIVQEFSDPLGVDCLDELEKMIKAESIIKMEEQEVEFLSRQQDDPLDLVFSAEEKMDSYNHLISNPLQSGISSQLTQSVQGDPLYVKEEEEELLEVKIEEEEDTDHARTFQDHQSRMFLTIRIFQKEPLTFPYKIL